MLFNSYEFLLFFLPVAVCAYFLLNKISKDIGKYALLLLSVVFIGSAGVKHIAIAIISTIVNYYFYNLISNQTVSKRKKTIFTFGIIFNVALLCTFKYMPVLSGEGFFPLGLSFYTFQQIAFLTDAYRNEVQNVKLDDYAVFTLFFPKAIQGPIVYASELIPAIKDSDNKCFSFDNFSKGTYLFSIGLAKKVMLADNFGIIADFGYQNISGLNSYEAILTILAYTFQLYFDFSGYSDMAIGIGYMINSKLPINFDSPYKAKNISEFWKRWHITLTRFLTKYIYIPLGGSRKGVRRTYLNILVVFVISGIWHGTGLTFVVWGIMHGLAMVCYRAFSNGYDKLPVILQWILNFLFVNIAWVFFRAESLTAAVSLIKRVFVGGIEVSLDAALVESLLQPTVISVLSKLVSVDVVIAGAVIIAIIIVAKAKNSMELCSDFRPEVKSLAITYLLLVMSILSLSGVSGFLYTNF